MMMPFCSLRTNIPGQPAVASIISFADPSVAGFHAVDEKVFVVYPVFSESKKHQLKILITENIAVCHPVRFTGTFSCAPKTYFRFKEKNLSFDLH